jgi:hypothetical protein
MACRIYILVLLLETIVDIAVEGELLFRVHEEDKSPDEASTTTRMPVYLSIFAVAQLVYPSSVARDARSCPVQRVSVCAGIGRRVCTKHAAVHVPDVSPLGALRFAQTYCFILQCI